MLRRAGRFEHQLIMLLAPSVLSCAQEGPRSSDPPESSGTSASATGDPSGEMQPLDADRWHDIDDGVETRELDVRFDEPGDEVQIWTGDAPPSGSVGQPETVVLASEMSTHRATDWGVTFEVRLRGTGSAAGGTVDISVRRAMGSDQYGGEVEAEDERAASGWIEVEFARLRVPAE